MSFFRPAALATLRRYGEPAVFAVIAILALGKGIELIWRGTWFGLVPTILGGLAALATLGAIERLMIARRSGHSGPGVVLIDEGRISFFSPLGGVVMALDEIKAVEVVLAGRVGEEIEPYWVLRDLSGAIARIPSAAENSETLIDVLSVLPGFDRMAVVAAMSANRPARFAIWQRI